MSNEMAEAIVLAVRCIVGAAKDGGINGAPSGVVFAALSAHGMNLTTYTSLVDTLRTAGVITQKSNVLYWTGKELSEAFA